MEFGTYPTGWYIEGDLLNQVAVSTGSVSRGTMGAMGTFAPVLLQQWGHSTNMWVICVQQLRLKRYSDCMYSYNASSLH